MVEVAEEPSEYQPAKSRIEGNRVIASATTVPAPKLARYAWRDNPQSNLVNSAGLPGVPFQTDGNQP